VASLLGRCASDMKQQDVLDPGKVTSFM